MSIVFSFAHFCVCLHVLQLSGFTSDPRELCSCLYDLETNVCESFSILLVGANLLNNPNKTPYVQVLNGSFKKKKKVLVP